MNIWVIGRNYPSQKNKMCGSFELEQAKMLCRKGHKVSYIACVFHPLYKAKKWGSCSWNEDVHIYTYSQFYAPQRLNLYWDSFKSKKWENLLKTVEEKEGTPDIIHVHYPTMITVPDVILKYKNKGTKIFATEHWSKVQSGALNVHELRQLRTYVDEVNNFICVGMPLKKEVEHLCGQCDNICVIPNVVPELFKKSTKTHTGFRFVAVGRLVPLKQFDKIIDAFNSCFHGDTEVSLTIVGGGNQFWRLKRLVEKFGISKQVILTGQKDRVSTAEIVRNSDVLVSFSKIETFGVPIIEAWYSGIPAIGTDTIGLRDYWRSEMGELISWENVNELANQMKKIKENYKDYSKEIISDYAFSYFSEDAVYHQLYSLYVR